MGESALRVLLVDDDVDTTEAISMLLEMAGHETLVVHDGLEVVEAARRFVPDVILLDLGLPGIDGCEVASLLRQERLMDNTLLVAVTGWSSRTQQLAAEKAGCNLVLTKPVQFAALKAVFAQAQPLR